MAQIKKGKPKKKAAPAPQKQPQKPQKSSLPAVKPDIPQFGPKPFAPPAFSAGNTAKTTKIFAAKPKFFPEEDFLKTFKELTCYHRAWDVWNDFIIMAACALSNPVDKTHYEEREARYLRIIKNYRKDEQRKFPTLFAHLVMALELNPEQDFLGKLYTSLNLQDEGRRQHFTPYSVSQLMADITLEGIAEQVREHGYVTINDPCCGAGSTLIAAAHSARKILQKMDLNFQNHILVTAQDIDETVALMCYIQLSLLGVAACIKVGNTLTDPMSNDDTMENYWFTPMYFSDVWAMRRLVRKMDELFQSDTPKTEKKPFKMLVELEEKECHCSLTDFYTNVAKKAGFKLKGAVRFDCAKIRCTEAVKDELFHFYQESGKPFGAISMFWVNCGPMANLGEFGYTVEIEDGFIVEGGSI